MAEKVAKTKIERDNAYMYFVNKGAVWRTPRAVRGKKRKGRREVVAQLGISQDPHYLYFLDKHGDVSRAKRAAGKRKTTKKTRKK